MCVFSRSCFISSFLGLLVESKHLIEVSELDNTTSLAKFNARAIPSVQRFQLYPAAAAAASASVPAEKKALLKSLAALDESKPKRPRLTKTARRTAAKHVQYPWCRA